MLRSHEPAPGLAEGARFELAVHKVDAGFQDRWFQPLTHPSDNVFNYLWVPLLLFIKTFTNLRCAQGIRNVGGLEIDVPLVDLHRALTSRFIATSTGIPWRAHSVKAVFLRS